MIRNAIASLSKEFLNEAKNSPQLLADMAAMEKHMAESYGERIFIELLQNSDDAGSSRIEILYKDRHVFFANNGKPGKGCSDRLRGRGIETRIEADVIPLSREGRKVTINEFPQNVSIQINENGTEVIFNVMPKGKRKQNRVSY